MRPRVEGVMVSLTAYKCITAFTIFTINGIFYAFTSKIFVKPDDYVINLRMT